MRIITEALPTNKIALRDGKIKILYFDYDCTCPILYFPLQVRNDYIASSLPHVIFKVDAARVQVKAYAKSSDLYNKLRMGK